MTADFTFTYHAAQRDLFRSGSLADDWVARYPMIFDRADRNLVKNQPAYHFFEWLSAVLLYEATGLLILVESYTASTHPKKRETLQEIVGTDIFNWLAENESGQPDLFAFRPGTEEWFFCEVKGGPDRERENQRAWTEKFHTLLGCRKIKGERMRMIQLREIKF